MKRVLFSSALFCALTNAVLAMPTNDDTPQNTPNIKSLNGGWTVRMDKQIDGELGADAKVCKMNIVQKEDSFSGTFTTGNTGNIVNGYLYDDVLVSAIQFSSDPNNRNYYVFSGRMSADGTIKGTYYNSSGESGDFDWSNTGAALVDAPKTKSTAAYYAAPSKKAPAKGAAQQAAKPVETATATDVPLPTADTQYHTVEQGESMYRIGLKYKVMVKQIMAWNGRTDPALELGEKLRVSE